MKLLISFKGDTNYIKTHKNQPYLQFYFLSLQFDRFNFEIDTWKYTLNGGAVFSVKAKHTHLHS